jgi:ATP-dependent exoDNAse (exonuclease V) beta subunit
VRIDVVSASAGTGKTHRLTEELVAALLDGSARPEGVVAITYTVKAAGELASRIRARLLAAGRADLAARVRDGYLGTIHAVCQRLLREAALEAGLSPFLEPIPESERRRLFSLAVAAVAAGREGELNALARRLELEDWKEPLLAIVDAARTNGLDAAGLAASAARSREGLERLLGAPDPRVDHLAALRAALARLLPKLDELAQGTVKADKDRRAAARRLQAALDRGQLPSWKSQVQLAASVGTKKLAPFAGELVALVDGHLGGAAFRDDLLGLQAALFELAGRALQVFVDEKAAAGVIDFGDMLALARELLDRPAVQAALRARLDLVLVDEFQDTSPLQLAVVGALGGLARRSVWVGDRKQAIFGFQGSDPDLMTAAAQAALGARRPDILATSHRSRPPLVDLCSALFARALAPHGFPPEQVALTAAAPDPAPLAGQPAFECWRWPAGTVEVDGEAVTPHEADAIADGVARLLADPPRVRERGAPAGAATRPASRRDLAVLARSNGRCREIAAALAARGIPAKVSLSGLTATPEAVLARAALALLADPADGVAALEVGWLGGGAGGDPDGWLSGRLAEMAAWRAAADRARQAGERVPPRPLAFAADPRVAALRAAATEAARCSPAEALDLALRQAAVAEHVRSWPAPGQRLANLEALRGEALAYEQLCAAQRTAGTVLGLVAHLAQLGDGSDEEGRQAAPGGEDAVTVATWHKAKGLEWPVVVLSQLDFARERSVFEPSVEPAGSFDFARPLEGRWIRWWPWPYGRMSSGLALLDRARRTAEAARTLERDRRERLRLLYVGFTRPRDLLVLCAGVTAKGVVRQEALQLLRDGDGAPLLEAPFQAPPGAARLVAAGQGWPCTVRELSGLPLPPAAAARGATRWYAAAPAGPRPRETVNPSAEPLDGEARILQVTRLGGRHEVTASADLAGPVGDAIHAFLAADRPGDAAARGAMASRLLAGFGVAGAVAPGTLLAAADALRRWLDARWPGAAWFREWPVRARLAGEPARLLVGEVDLFLELPDGFVLVDHKSFPGGAEERDRRLLEAYAPQLRWYARALKQALGKPLRGAFIHLPVRGEVAELDLGMA